MPPPPPPGWGWAGTGFACLALYAALGAGMFREGSHPMGGQTFFRKNAARAIRVAGRADRHCWAWTFPWLCGVVLFVTVIGAIAAVQFARVSEYFAPACSASSHAWSGWAGVGLSNGRQGGGGLGGGRGGTGAMSILPSLWLIGGDWCWPCTWYRCRFSRLIKTPRVGLDWAALVV